MSSRIAKTPIVILANVRLKLEGQVISIQGEKGELTYSVDKSVAVKYADNVMTFSPRDSCVNSWAKAGTARALLNAMVIGVTEGFTKKLQLVGVGYRASIQGSIINLSLGFSHSVDFKLPKGITAECPSQTEIILKSINKQLIGQIAADLRSYRRPEPYKGKGVRYANEIIRIKDTKKK